MSLSSYAKFYDVLMSSRALPASAKLVLTALVNFSRLGNRNPKVETLALKTGQTLRTTERALQALRELKLITTTWGQRQSSYEITPLESWPYLLNRQSGGTGSGFCSANMADLNRQSGGTEPSASLLLKRTIKRRGFQERFRDNYSRAREAAQKSTLSPPLPAPAPDPPPTIPWLDPLMAQMGDIYRRAGLPIAAKQDQLIRQLIIGLEEHTRSRVPERLPRYCMWALAVGRWPSAAKTKALVNVLRDGDWDVELAVRSLPPASADSPRAAVVAAAEHRFMERQKSKYGAF